VLKAFDRENLFVELPQFQSCRLQKVLAPAGTNSVLGTLQQAERLRESSLRGERSMIEIRAPKVRVSTGSPDEAASFGASMGFDIRKRGVLFASVTR